MYIHSSDPDFATPRSLPKNWKAPTGETHCNIDALANSDPQKLADLGFIEVPEVPFNSAWQDKVYDSVTKQFVVSAKSLNEVVQRKTEELKAEGKEVVLAKYSKEDIINAMGDMLSPAENTAIRADISTIRNHWKNTVKPALAAANTAQEANSVVANWPVI